MNKYLLPFCALLFSSYSFGHNFLAHKTLLPVAKLQSSHAYEDFSGTWRGQCFEEEDVRFIIKQNSTQIEFIDTDEDAESSSIFTINNLETHNTGSASQQSVKISDALLSANFLRLISYELTKKNNSTGIMRFEVMFILENDTLTMYGNDNQPQCEFKRA